MTYALQIGEDGSRSFPVVERLPIAVLISGSGSTLRNLLELERQERLAIQTRLVISSSAAAGGLKFAAEFGVESQVLKQKRFATQQDYSDAIFAACREAGAALVVMGGFLKHVLIPKDYEHRVLNVHPSLIPAFCGTGYYGRHVHQAVLDYGCKLTGCTIHFVDNQYDHGPILAQCAIPVQPGETTESLAQKVGKLEREEYPRAIQAIIEGRVRILGREVNVAMSGK